MRVPTFPHHIARPQHAAALILIAMALMGLVDNYVVVIADTAGLWQFQVIRSAMAMALLAAVARGTGWRLRPVSWARVAARSAVLSAALMIYFAALAVLPIAQAVAGLFTAPMFILLISMAAYGERVGAVRLAAVVAGFAGVLMVLRPDAGAVGVLTILPILSGFLYALAQLATRRWCAAESAPTLLAGFFVAMGIWGIGGLAWLALFPQPVPDGAAGWALRLWGAMSAEAWVWTIAQAVFSLVAVGFIIRAYQMGEASTNAVFEYALLVFAVIWGWILLGNGIDGLAAAGIALILGSGAVIALRSPAPPAPVPEG